MLEPAIWICIFLPIFIALFLQHQEQKKAKQRHALKIGRAHKKKGGIYMSEVIKRFIGKECIITTMSENVIGKVEAVDDNWLIVDSSENKADCAEIINIDYISRIREYPRKKKKQQN